MSLTGHVTYAEFDVALKGIDRNDFAFLEATHATGAIGAYAVPLKESEFHSRLHLVATAN